MYKIFIKNKIIFKIWKILYVISERKNNDDNNKNILCKIYDNKIKFISNNIDINSAIVLKNNLYKIKHSKSIENTILFPGQKIFNILKNININEDLEIRIKNKRIKISSNKSSFTVCCIYKKDILSEKVNIKESFNIFEAKINILNFIKSINDIMFCISNNNSRHILNSMLIEFDRSNNINVVATDGYKMGINRIPISIKNNKKLLKTKLIISRISLFEIKKIFTILLRSKIESINISINDNGLLFKKNNIYIYIKLVNGNFPNYKNVIPCNNDKIIKIKKDILYDSLTKVSSLSHDFYRLVVLSIKNKEIVLSCKNIDNESSIDIIKCNVNINFSLSIGLNIDYLIKIVSSFNEGETILLSFSDNISSVILSGNIKKYLNYIISPIKL